MNKIILLVLVIVLVAGGYFLLRNNKSDTSSDNIIDVTEDGFSPSILNIKQGETVVFKNTGIEDHWPASAIHPTHQIYPEFDPKRPVAPGDSWSFTFDKAGSWKFHDHLIPKFFGTINVE